MFSFKNKIDNELKYSMENNEYKTYRVLVHYKNLKNKIKNKINRYKGNVICSIDCIDTFCASMSPYALNRLIEHPEIDYVCEDKTAIVCAQEQSIAKANRISIKNKLKLTGNKVGIGLIDTGVYPHGDLLNPDKKIVHFTDLIRNFKYPYDDNGHGTFISGILSGSGTNSKGDIKGIAENSHIYSIKAFNGVGHGYVSNILFALQELICQSKEFNIKLICLPCELLENNKFILSLFHQIFDLAVSNGITIIVPAGHNGIKPNSIKGIATLNNCITVGGVDTSTGIYKQWEFSSGGKYKNCDKPDLVASCVNIISLNTNKFYLSERKGMKVYPKHLENLYTTYSGTSCSAAYICGLCALILEKKPNLNFNDLLSILKVSCTLLDIPKHIQGSGIVNLSNLFDSIK